MPRGVTNRQPQDRCECTCGKVGCVTRQVFGSPAEHGTQTAFAAGCHCDECTAAVNHGTSYSYGLGCRCADCTQASNEHGKRRMKRLNDASIDRAEKRGQQWTGADLEIATRPDLTAREAAEMLGRSMRAVYMIRNRCRTDPKYQRVIGAQS